MGDTSLAGRLFREYVHLLATRWCAEAYFWDTSQIVSE